ncbi:acrosin-like [Sorghum bicolor]|uniref:acrosin-like n=1 Tax=Sorghum bicolor TaxID=4558 RepID=UPI000B424847|nr:acrosin-like [Sorghum bicolor]|eukprot:XP_021308444.1 acrosin-like [Sorghum bicolor]
MPYYFFLCGSRQRIFSEKIKSPYLHQWPNQTPTLTPVAQPDAPHRCSRRRRPHAAEAPAPPPPSRSPGPAPVPPLPGPVRHRHRRPSPAPCAAAAPSLGPRTAKGRRREDKTMDAPLSGSGSRRVAAHFRSRFRWQITVVVTQIQMEMGLSLFTAGEATFRWNVGLLAKGDVMIRG